MKCWRWPMPTYTSENVKETILQGNSNKPPAITFTTWDFGGQLDFYASHQCLMTRERSLYLVLWKLSNCIEEGLELYIKQWLLNIEARAPKSKVIIVGTHRDELNASDAEHILQTYRQHILENYRNKRGFPTILGHIDDKNNLLFDVSCDAGKCYGIGVLKEAIYWHAYTLKDEKSTNSTNRDLRWMVPKSYIELGARITRDRYNKEHLQCNFMVDMPEAGSSKYVLSESEIWSIIRHPVDVTPIWPANPALTASKQKELLRKYSLLLKPPSADEIGSWENISGANSCDVIRTEEDLQLACRFLHSIGVMLHYPEISRCYFTNPQWFSGLFSRFIAIKAVHSFVTHGELKIEHCQHFLRDQDFPLDHIGSYIKLLETFELAFRLDDATLLIPSQLPEAKPPTKYINFISKVKQRACNGHDVSSDSDKEEEFVHDENSTDVWRIYRMCYVPPGFWSRLLVRIMMGARRWNQEQARSKNQNRSISERNRRLSSSSSRSLTRKATIRSRISGRRGEVSCEYWREGLRIFYNHGRTEVEAIQKEMFPGDAARIQHGVLITCHSENMDFSSMAFIVQEIDSLIKEWYPGLLDLDSEGNDLVQRMVPCTVCVNRYNKRGDDTNAWTKASPTGIAIFTLEKCATTALSQYDHLMYCPTHAGEVRLQILVPDLLLTDLPHHLHLDARNLVITTDEDSYLGAGAMGFVYKGKYRDKIVAVKEYHTSSGYQKYLTKSASADSLNQKVSTNNSSVISPNNGSRIRSNVWAVEATEVFIELRSELTVHRALRHPCICELIGVCTNPLALVLELASCGNLLGVIQNEMRQIQRKYWLNNEHNKNEVVVSKADPILCQSGKRSDFSGKLLTYKIALEIASALSYLHSQDIIYRDLKPENVLIYNLDVGCSSESLVSAKLSDYGISCFITPQGAFGNKGTAGYQAPEVIDKYNTSAYDAKVDIYSYSMILYYLLFGLVPFHYLSHSAAINEAVLNKERPKVQDNVHLTSVIDLMMACWCHEASDRPSTSTVHEILSQNVVQLISHRKVLPAPLPQTNTNSTQPDFYIPAGYHAHQSWSSVFATCTDELDGSVWMIIQSQITMAKRQTVVECWRIDVKYNGAASVIPGIINGDSDSLCDADNTTKIGGSICRVKRQLWVANTFRNIDVYEIQQDGRENNMLLQFLTTYQTKHTVVEIKSYINTKGLCDMYATLSNGYLATFRTLTNEDDDDSWITLRPLCLTNMENSQAEQMVLERDDKGTGDDSVWIGCGTDLVRVNCKSRHKEGAVQVYENLSVTSPPPTPPIRRTSFSDSTVAVKLLGVHQQHVFCNNRRDTRIHVYNSVTCQYVHLMDCSPRKCSLHNVVLKTANKVVEPPVASSHALSSSSGISSDEQVVERGLMNGGIESVAQVQVQVRGSSEQHADDSYSLSDIDEGLEDKVETSLDQTSASESSGTVRKSVSKFSSTRRRRGKICMPSSRGVNSEETNQSEATKCCILNLAVIEDTLWVVRSVGDIVVLCIQQDGRATTAKFGEVIAIMKLPQVCNYEFVDFKVLLPVGKHVIGVVSYLRRSGEGIKRFSQLHMWDKLTADNITTANRVQQRLQTLLNTCN